MNPAPGENEIVKPPESFLEPSPAPRKVMVEARGLSKTFAKQDALKSVSFVVREGESFGFIGPNGAGKTTTIRILATLLEPTQGQAFIDGIPVIDEPDAVKEIMGYMPDYFGVYDGMKVFEYLEFFASAYKKNPAIVRNLVNDVLEITDLTVKRDSFTETLSKGMRQRLCIAKTLLHDPKVLILDEPASGLDPRARIELKELLKELNRMGKTVFISSHILPELADICSTVGIIEAGNLLAFGSVQDFTENVKSTTIRTINVRCLGDGGKLAQFLQKQEKVMQVEESESGLKVEFSGGQEEMAQLLEELVRRSFRIVEFSQECADLEDVFMRITKGEVV
jgi:ABC-2 type transport system ATP-binding protein